MENRVEISKISKYGGVLKYGYPQTRLVHHVHSFSLWNSNISWASWSQRLARLPFGELPAPNNAFLPGPEDPGDSRCLDLTRSCLSVIEDAANEAVTSDGLSGIATGLKFQRLTSVQSHDISWFISFRHCSILFQCSGTELQSWTKPETRTFSWPWQYQSTTSSPWI